MFPFYYPPTYHQIYFFCSFWPRKKLLAAFDFSPAQCFHLANVANLRRAGMKKYEHRGRQWHADCFVCKSCQQPIGTNTFIPRGNDVVCVPCFEQHCNQYCTKCGKVCQNDLLYHDNNDDDKVTGWLINSTYLTRFRQGYRVPVLASVGFDCRNSIL